MSEQSARLPVIDGPVDTPEKIISDSLRVVQACHDRIFGEERLIDDLSRHMDVVSISVNTFGVAFLMEMLRQVDPVVAARAARELWDIWDAGDVQGEITWEWAQQIIAGRPIDEKGRIFGPLLNGDGQVPS